MTQRPKFAFSGRLQHRQGLRGPQALLAHSFPGGCQRAGVLFGVLLPCLCVSGGVDGRGGTLCVLLLLSLQETMVSRMRGRRGEGHVFSRISSTERVGSITVANEGDWLVVPRFTGPCQTGETDNAAIPELLCKG